MHDALTTEIHAMDDEVKRLRREQLLVVAAWPLALGLYVSTLLFPELLDPSAG